MFYIYCFQIFRHLKFTILTASFNSKEEVVSDGFLLWRSGFQEPEDLQYGSIEFKNSMKDANVIRLFNGPSPVMNIQVRPSLVFTSPNQEYFRQRRRFLYSVNLYLKRWNEDEIIAAVSVLRNMNSIGLAITDTVIKKAGCLSVVPLQDNNCSVLKVIGWSV